MKIETYQCTKTTSNTKMGTECWDGDVIFYFDRNQLVKVGDEVKFERDENGFYSKIWVNGDIKKGSLDFHCDCTFPYCKELSNCKSNLAS